MAPRPPPPRAANSAAPDTKELVALFQAGRYADVEATARRLLQQHAASGFLWKALGAALQLQGKDALDALRRAAALLPGDAEAHSNLAGALLVIGDIDAALQSSRRALELKPNAVDALCNYGSALLAMTRFDDAVASLNRAVELNPAHALAWNSLGNALQGLHHYDDAIAAYRRALALVPHYAEAYNNLGKALRDTSRMSEAIDAYRQALAHRPGYIEAQCNLAAVLLDVGQFGAAADGLRHALAQDPNLAEAHLNLANVLRILGSAEDAEASCRAALRIKPNMPGALAVLSEFLADKGEFHEAEAACRQAIAIDPGNAAAWAGIARVRKMGAADGDWFAAATRLAAQGIAPRDEAQLQYALGKAYDDIGDYAHAFAHYRRANDLDKSYRRPYEPDAEQREAERIIASCSSAWVRRHRQSANESARPVFVVGMPRSGTSLAEQILASHSQVHGAGELTYWPAALADSAMKQGELGDLTDPAVAALADGYLSLLDKLAPGAARVVDKMPANHRHLGAIAAAFPNARFIHMQRNPVDVCLSIYFQNFTTHAYSNALPDLVHYYGLYRRLMAHWRTALPQGMLLDVVYEELVQDQESWSRKMIDFIGLPWDDACLRFHEHARTVGTFSNWQVRQKISKASVERWRHYEAHVGPLKSLIL